MGQITDFSAEILSATCWPALAMADRAAPAPAAAKL